MTDLELVEARWRVGHILASELASVAVELREAGLDAPALREVADMPPAALRVDGRRAFERALRELGGGGMSASEAALVVARRFAQLLLAGTITPSAAAKAIAELRWKAGPDVDRAFAAFDRLAARYEDASRSLVGRFPARRLDAAARAEARNLADAAP